MESSVRRPSSSASLDGGRIPSNGSEGGEVIGTGAADIIFSEREGFFQFGIRKTLLQFLLRSYIVLECGRAKALKIQFVRFYILDQGTLDEKFYKLFAARL